jgi:hypothetical protein
MSGGPVTHVSASEGTLNLQEYRREHFPVVIMAVGQDGPQDLAGQDGTIGGLGAFAPQVVEKAGGNIAV